MLSSLDERKSLCSRLYVGENLYFSQDEGEMLHSSLDKDHRI